MIAIEQAATEEISPSCPQVSIIIPCYNAAPMLERCLSSCFEQTYPHLEIILVDNNSTDDSMQIARQLASITKRRITITQCQQQGHCLARNHGFILAKGDYIQWLDADDELTPEKIAIQVAALERDLSYDLAYGDWEWNFYNGQQRQLSLTFNSQPFDDPLRNLLLDHWHPPHAYLLRISAAQQLHDIQAWYPQREVNADTEYFTLAALLGMKFLYVPGAMARYNSWSKEQISRATPYKKRIDHIKQIAKRAQEVAQRLPIEKISAEHWFLLQLNWDFWKLAPTELFQEGENCFWLEQRANRVGMTLRAFEVRIVLAMHQLKSVDTLMGHSSRIVRFLSRQAMLDESGVNRHSVDKVLSQWVGLLPDERLFSLDKNLPFECQAIGKENALIDAVPLSAPLFTEQRFAILKLLDKLRVAGLLMQVTL